MSSRKKVLDTLLHQYISILAETGHTEKQILREVKNARTLITRPRGGVEAVFDYEEAISYLSNRTLIVMLEYRGRQATAYSS